jgi:hypothetical protein
VLDLSQILWNLAINAGFWLYWRDSPESGHLCQIPAT